ncbi:MAG: TetR/AcrR family transcriptional regulator [Ferruginibacter sp.]
MGKKNAKLRIIDVTKILLAEKAMDQISVREIAIAAKVNTAAINYYFSTKELLFSEALDQLVIEGQDEWLEKNIDPLHPDKKDLLNYLEFLHTSCIENKGFAKTRILGMLNAEDINPANLKVYETIYRLAKDLRPKQDDRLLRIRVSIAFSSVISFSLSTVEIEFFAGFSPTKKNALRQYISTLITLLFQD